MRSSLAYAPRATPLGRASAAAAAFHLLAFAVVALISPNPIVLAGCAAAAAIAGLAGGAQRALAVTLRWSLFLGALIIAVNAIASQRGATILFRFGEVPVLGQMNISAEAIAEGGVLALRIATVIALFAVLSACVDPDRLTRLARPIARRSALTATLITRMVPLAADDHMRLREAVALRGPGAAPVGRAALLERLVACSLDRAVDVASTLELRGYASGPPRRADVGPMAPGDLAFWITGVAVLVVGIAARIAGVGGWEAYPTVEIDTDAATLALAAFMPLAAALPPLLERVRGGASLREEPAHV